MLLSGAVASGWYVPNIGDNRKTQEFKIQIRGMTAGEYRAAIAASVVDKSTTGLGTEDKGLLDAIDDEVIRRCCTAIEGLNYQPSENEAPIVVTQAEQLLVALRSSGDVDAAMVIRADILEAIKDRSHLKAGLVPT